MFKVHNYKDPIRLHVNGTVCLVCLKEFHTRERIIQHLKFRPGRTNVCRYNTLDMDPFLSIEQADLVDAELKDTNRKLQANAKRRHFAEIPCFRMPGPLIYIRHVGKGSKHSGLGFGHNYYN